MQSSGGLASLDEARAHAALTVLSGPAGGAAGAAWAALAAGEPDALCFDMGGTSCDVCVIEGGAVREASGRPVGGRPVALPMLDVHTVGAGGGSIAWRDAGGALRVGPQSAGARPGPAAYGHGGTEPTVTDANLVLGRLGESATIALDKAKAEAAVGALAEQLGLGLVECAAGIVRVADAEMVRALRVMTVERGVDPRGLALLAFGGAGALHAAAIAEELGMTRILCPRAAGVLAALGLVVSDRRRDVQRSVLLSGEALTGDAVRAEVARARRRRPRRGGAPLPRPGLRARGGGGPRRPARGVRGRPRAGLRLPRPRRRGGARHAPRRPRRRPARTSTRTPRAPPPGARRPRRAAPGSAGRSARPPSSPASPPPARRSPAPRSPSCPRRRSPSRPAGRASSCPPARSGWTADEHRPGHAPRRLRRPARGVRGDGRGADPRLALREHQGAPRRLLRAVRPGRPDGHAGRAHPGAPRRDARRGRGRHRRGPPPRRVLGAQRPLPRRHAPAGHHRDHAGLRRGRRAARLRRQPRAPRRRGRADARLDARRLHHARRRGRRDRAAGARRRPRWRSSSRRCASPPSAAPTCAPSSPRTAPASSGCASSTAAPTSPRP